MNTYKRAKHEVYHTQQQRNCTHPDSSIEVEIEGNRVTVRGGEVDDSTREIMFCRDCGLEVEMVDPTPTEMQNYIGHDWGFA